jgi:non-heme Fe2+,alpha-ketoglutarate-dependent halogenase
VVTAWFAISEASVEAGCMSVLPGSHLGRTLEHEDTYHEDNMLTRGQAIKAIDESRAVSMPLRAGEMSIHNYCLAHGSGPNLSGDRRIGVSMHFMPPQTQQIVGKWDCAALVRGEDRYGNFVPTPVPARDFDPVAVAFHAQAAKAMRDVLYAGAEKNLQRL